MRLMLETRMTNRAHQFSSLATPAIVAVALLTVGCASGGVNLKQPFQPPSFEAKVYENTELGFSLHYPADFLEEDVPPDLPGFELALSEAEWLLLATPPQQLPNVAILLHPADEPELSLEAFGEGVAAVYAQIGGGEAEIESARETTLQDGVTEAMEFIVEWSLQGFPIKTLTLFVSRGPQTVQVQVTWAPALGDRASLNVDEIAYSLYFE